MATLAAGCLTAALVACSGSQAPPPPPCPKALFLKGAERTAAYTPGPDPGPEDLQHLAVLTDLVSACAYEDSNVYVPLRFNLIAEKGPAYRDGPFQLTYFVATLGPDQNILSKQLFDTEVTFAEGAERAGNTQEMTVRIPGAGPDTGRNYRVYLGFQLDEAEMRRRLEPLQP